MLDNPVPVLSLCKSAYQRLLYPDQHENHLQTTNFLQRKPCFFKVIPGVLDPLVNFNITQRFLLRQSVFPDYLSVSCGYDKYFLPFTIKGLYVKMQVAKTETMLVEIRYLLTCSLSWSVQLKVVSTACYEINNYRNNYYQLW